MRTFIGFEDKTVELVRDELAVNGDWYEFESHYNLEAKLKELEKKGEPYVIKSIQYLKVMEPKMYGMVSVLNLLEHTNCGHCNAPWISEEIFDDLVTYIKEYTERGNDN